MLIFIERIVGHEQVGKEKESRAGVLLPALQEVVNVISLTPC